MPRPAARPRRHAYAMALLPSLASSRAGPAAGPRQGTAACAAARRAGRFWRDARDVAADAAQAGGRGGLTTAAGRGGRGATSSSCATRRGINALWCDAGGRLRRRVAWGCVRVRPTRPPAAGGRARDAGRGHAGPALRRRLMPLGAMRGRGRGCPPWLPPGRALTGTCQPLPVDDGRGRRPAPFFSVCYILPIFGRSDRSSMLLLLLLRAVPVMLKGKPLRTQPWTLCYASRPVRSHVGSCVFHHMVVQCLG